MASVNDPSLRFSHVALNCRDQGAVERFYSRHFGFRRARTISLDEGEIVFLKCGDVYLELFAVAADSAGPTRAGDGPLTPGVRHLAFQVDDVDTQLESMGEDAVVSLGPLDFDGFIPGWRTVWLSDPEGNIVEVSQGFVDEKPVATGRGTATGEASAVATSRTKATPGSRDPWDAARTNATPMDAGRKDQW
ncbi:MAG: VOC family protein [Trueperaceae bacterium]